MTYGVMTITSDGWKASRTPLKMYIEEFFLTYA